MWFHDALDALDDVELYVKDRAADGHFLAGEIEYFMVNEINSRIEAEFGDSRRIDLEVVLVGEEFEVVDEAGGHGEAGKYRQRVYEIIQETRQAAQRMIDEAGF